MTSYLDALPRRVAVHTLMDVVLQAHGQPCHELRAGSDTVAVKMGACWLHWRELTAARLQLLTDSLDLLNLFTAEQETMEGSAVNTDTNFVVKPDRVLLRGQLFQICGIYMHLVKLTSWQNSKLQFMLINRTFLCKSTSSDMFYHDFRNCLVLFKPCISQGAGFN